MKKRVILALAFSVSVFAFAQKKELRTVDKAIRSNNFAEAKTALDQAKSMMSAMDKDQKADYYYYYGQALYANGAGTNEDLDAALLNLDKVDGEYVSEIKEIKENITNKMITRGNKAYEDKDFKTSSNYFEKAYRLRTSDTTFLYYAASMAINIPDYTRALGLYEELKDLGYTGIETTYFAVNKETNEKESFQNKEMRDLSVKADTHIKPTNELTESRKAEIVKNIALIYKENGDDDKAIEALVDARKENPDDLNLLMVEAEIQLKLGNREAFKVLMEEATTKDPNNAELRYNLGVIANESGDKEAAKKHYTKATELNPEHVNAYINLASIVLSGEADVVTEMNGLGTSNKDNLRYDELKNVRQEIYKDAIPYLEKAVELSPDNIDAAKTLVNIYNIVGETDKSKAMKAKVDALESGN